MTIPSNCIGESGFAGGHKVPQSGFTLVELMVAIALGLIVTLVITGAVLTMGRQFRITGANAAAQGSAQVALGLIDAVGRSAGAGLYSNSQPVCSLLNAWRDGAVLSNGAVFMPVRITDGGGAGTSDVIVFTAASGVGALSAMPVVENMATAGAVIRVGNIGSIQNNDLALIGVPSDPTVPCTLFQANIVTSPPGSLPCGANVAACKSLTRTTLATGFNPVQSFSPPSPFATVPRYGYDNGAPGVSGPAVVTRLGAAFRQDAFRVLCNSLVQYNAFTDAPACTAVPLGFSGGAQPLAMDVVLMQAQYGISVGGASDIVTNWVNAVNVGGTDWSNPSVGNAARVKAVRVIIVTRSKEPQNATATAASCTNTGGVVNTGPCSFDDAEAPAIDLSAIPVPAGRTWQNYGYRVHQAVVPLRNVIWSN